MTVIIKTSLEIRGLDPCRFGRHLLKQFRGTAFEKSVHVKTLSTFWYVMKELLHATIPCDHHQYENVPESRRTIEHAI